MARNEIKLSDWLRVIRREIAMGLILGSLLGFLGWGAGLFLAPTALYALIIPITILCVVICGTLSGSLLPLFFRRMGLDPALMSNPFVAGIVDILGIIIYMSVAGIFYSLYPLANTLTR